MMSLNAGVRFSPAVLLLFLSASSSHVRGAAPSSVQEAATARGGEAQLLQDPTLSGRVTINLAGKPLHTVLDALSRAGGKRLTATPPLRDHRVRADSISPIQISRSKARTW